MDCSGYIAATIIGGAIIMYGLFWTVVAIGIFIDD